MNAEGKIYHLTYLDWFILLSLAFTVGLGLLVIIDDPLYTDAFYYFNAGARLANGKGLTDFYLWNYLNAPDRLPVPSHTYWMPLASLVAAAGMAVFGVSFDAAQAPFIPFLVGLVALTVWLSTQLGGQRRHVYVTGLLILFGAFYFPYWVMTSTFVLYGLIGGGALVAMGLAQREQSNRWFILSGALCALAHLTRADGLLLLLTALFLASIRTKNRLRSVALVLGSYLIVITGWFIRMREVSGSPLPSGGIGTAFLRGYNEIFAYPVDWSFQNFLDWGLSNILQSRWEALIPNLATWIAVEGWGILMPFALVGLWKFRKEPLLTGFWLYAVLLHSVMTVIFAYPGYRGGLFHSSAALAPFWVVLGVLGMDAVTERLGRWRRWQRTGQAKAVFNIIAVGVALFLSFFALANQIAVQNQNKLPSIDEMESVVRADAGAITPVLMVNDPAKWYFYSGLAGITLPDTTIDGVRTLAGKYCVTHLVIDRNVTDVFEPLIDKGAAPPDFLHQIGQFNLETPDKKDDVRLYRFQQEKIAYALHCPLFSSD